MMTKNQKEFIEKAKIVNDEEKFSYLYKRLYIFNSGKMIMVAIAILVFYIVFVKWIMAK